MSLLRKVKFLSLAVLPSSPLLVFTKLSQPLKLYANAVCLHCPRVAVALAEAQATATR